MAKLRFSRLLAATMVVGLLASSPAHSHGPDAAPHRMADLGRFDLESGGHVPNLRISYVTHGTLSPAKDNAILVLHGFGANHHGFDGLIGAGKPLDTQKYFIIAPDQFGNTQIGSEHSTSPSNSGMKMAFPAYNHRDMIHAQHKLVTKALGIKRVVAILGISMGASQVVQFAVSHPDFMDSIIPIVGGPLYGNESRLWNTHFQRIIEQCAAWQNGQYTQNSTECAGTALTTLMHYFFSREWWDAHMSTQENFDQFHKAWWGFYLGVQDMRDLYYLSKAFERSSVASTPGFNGDMSAALRSIKARSLFVYSPKDMFFLPKSVEHPARLMPNARTVAIDSEAGHLICCGVDPQGFWVMGEAIRGFLTELNVVKREGVE